VANPFVHVELSTNDVAKAKAFYGSLFDWELEDVPMGPGTYTLIGVGGDGTGGGMMQSPVPGMPSGWLAYVEVENVADATARAKSLGATIVNDVTEIPDYGWFSVITDPTGAMLGLWTSSPS
jgi:predicted enzyme related to lactoylglutathione lyase